MDKDKVLIAKRSLSKNIAPSKYHIPGGHVEFGENPDTAIAWEFKEEFNIKIKPLNIIRSFSYIANDIHEVGIVYLIELEGTSSVDDIQIDENDNEEIIWLKKKEIAEFIPEDDNDYVSLMRYNF